jgi:mannose-6-phosphate isomerase-like protein (cupin superfamily)
MPTRVLNVEKETLSNSLYRKIVHTTSDMQLALMNLAPGEDIPNERHDGSQFIRVEIGKGVVRFNNRYHRLSDGIAVIIPKNTYHYIKNTSNTEDLKLYTVYAPPEHS